MQDILTSLNTLDTLYRADSFEAYERLWLETARLVRLTLPGFTIAYAELYNSGMSRLSDAAMSHVLVPLPEYREISYPVDTDMYNDAASYAS